MKASKYEELCIRQDTKEEINEIYRLAKERERKTIEFSNIRLVKGEDRKVLIDAEDVKNILVPY